MKLVTVNPFQSVKSFTEGFLAGREMLKRSVLLSTEEQVLKHINDIQDLADKYKVIGLDTESISVLNPK